MLARAHRVRLILTAAAILMGLMAGAGCPDRDIALVPPLPSREIQKSLPVESNRNIDILFVIDDSDSMKEEQASLTANFASFINVLTNIEGGLPNIHLGVVSTDLGGGADSRCAGTGDAGSLINTPRVRTGTCEGPTDRWIESIDDGNGGRITNFPADQTLAETFSCIAELGTQGCGFEQPLEAMKRALDNQANAGFIRDDAYLAVIFITDEDDCSVDPVGGTAMFANASCGNYLDKGTCPLGALDSFRCFEFGVQCDPDDPRAIGDKEASGVPCVPRKGSPYMPGVTGYADFLRQLKGSDSLVFTAGIYGPPSPVVTMPATKDYGQGPTNIVQLQPSCETSAGKAYPGTRLQAFFNQFPRHSATTTICNDDLTDALVQIATAIREGFGDPCLEGDIADRDPTTDGIQPECAVYDVQFPGTDDEVQSPAMPECDEQHTNKPCFYFEVDDEQCSTQPTHLKIGIDRVGDAPPPGTETQIRCAAI